MRRRSTRALPTVSSPRMSALSRKRLLDDPQIEGTRDVLRVLEPVLEGAMARDVLRVVDVREQLQGFAISFSGFMAMKPLT
jgi:hypothetical protein